MNEILFERFSRTDEFKDWLKRLDYNIRALINSKLDEYERNGCLPNTAGLIKKRGGVGKLRFHFGPGYRIYFCRYGKILILLLCAGDKDTQSTDLVTAKVIKARELKKLKPKNGR
jgi:putative addiction module killer protein